jgi:hypothetical protein
MTYDGLRERVVLFGGETAGGPVDDAWEWDGRDWLQRVPQTAPVARYRHDLVFDTARGRALLFGGSLRLWELADTWSYGATYPAAIAPFGAGCAGSIGTPALRTDGDRRPWLGERLTLRAQPLPATLASALLLGDSKWTWGNLSLPTRSSW